MPLKELDEIFEHLGKQIIGIFLIDSQFNDFEKLRQKMIFLFH